MTTILADAITMIDNTLAPITPAGVTGIEFISVFLIVYAITILLLSNIHFLKENRPAQLILALVIAFFTASSAFSVILITKLFPNVGAVTIIIISFLVVMALIPEEKRGFTLGPLLTIAGIGLVAYFTWTSMAGTLSLEGLNLPTLTRNEVYGIIFIAIFIGFILLIFLAGGKSKGIKGKKIKDFMKWLIGSE